MYRFLIYMGRDLLRWSRTKLNVISTMAMPVAWLLFVGLTLPTDFSDNYLDFITPSILVLTMLSAGLSGGSSLMFDKLLGYLNKFLVMPAPRETILMGKISFITVRGLLQAVVIITIATLIGATVQSPLFYIGAFGILMVFGIIIASFGTTLALFMKDHDTYSAVQAIIHMPLFFTSTALMPYDEMPGWLASIAHVNPVSYAINSIRAMAGGTVEMMTIVLLGATALVMVAVCALAFRKVVLS